MKLQRIQLRAVVRPEAATVRDGGITGEQRERVSYRGGGRKEHAITLERGDLVEVPVRAISADVVPGHWVDHSDPEHLKAAVGLLERAPVYPMHAAWPSDWLGFVHSPEWSDDPAGVNQVPGVDVVAAIDSGASDAAYAVARGVLAGSLVKWSLCFDVWTEPSHPGMDETEFEARLGQQDDEGRTFLWVAKEISDVHELSIVDIPAIESARTRDVPDPRLREAARRRVEQLDGIVSRGRFQNDERLAHPAPSNPRAALALLRAKKKARPAAPPSPRGASTVTAARRKESAG